MFLILNHSPPFHCVCAQSCPTLQDHRDCSPLDSSVCGTWDSPGKNTAVGCHALLQEIFLTQGWNPVCCVPCIPGRFFTASHREGPLPPPKLVLMSSFFLHRIEGVWSSVMWFNPSQLPSTVLVPDVHQINWTHRTLRPSRDSGRGEKYSALYYI